MNEKQNPALELRGVVDDTLSIIREEGYQPVGSVDWIDLAKPMKNMRTGSEIYTDILPKLTIPNPGYDTILTVDNLDTFERAKLFPGYEDVAVLNMASEIIPGGGVLKGSMAQEEELCRRSTLLGSLYRYWGDRGKRYLEISRGHKINYPLKPLGAIWSPEVVVIKNRRYQLLEEPFLVNVISMAAIRNPELTDDGEMIPPRKQLMCKKIRALLRLAANKGMKKLVLGAWGCGAFHCPPKQMAELFLRVINGEEMKGRFEEISFAILDNPGKRENNYEIFKSVICQSK